MTVNIKAFAGGVMNSNDAIDMLPPADFLDGVNLRVTTNTDNSQGLVVTLEGNRNISRSLPSGDNVVIRAKEFERLGLAVIFTKNSNGNHRIELFNYKTETFTTLYQDKTDSSNIQLLDWSGVVYIKDVVLVQDTFIYWTEFPTDVVRRININDLPTTFTADDFYIGVVPPSSKPVGEYLTDFDYERNNLTDLYQFRYRYKYKDGSYSTWSAISSIPTPVDMSGRPSNVLNNNSILVSFPLDSNVRYTGIDISHRVGNGDWVLTKEVSKAHIDSLPAYVIPNPLPDPPAPPDRGTLPKEGKLNGGYAFLFYNDGAYQVMDQLEHELLADIIPINTRAIEVVNDSTILLGNNKLGYQDVNWTSGYGATVSLYDGGTSSISSLFRVISSTVHFHAPYQDYEITVAGDPKEGDTISCWWTVDGGASGYVEFEVTLDEEDDREAVLTKFLGELIDDSDLDITGTDITATSTTATLKLTIPEDDSLTAITTNVSPESLDTMVKHAVKMGSSYQIAVAHYDRYGRPLNIVTGDAFKITTPSMAEAELTKTNVQIPKITWTIPTPAPTNAAYYTILSTKNLTHTTSIYARVNIDRDRSTVDTLVLDIGDTAYSYNPGDLVTIIGNVTEVGEVENHQKDPSFTLPIKGEEFVVDNADKTHHILNLTAPATGIKYDNRALLVEIFTPKGEQDREVFYEVAGPFPVTNGNHSVTSGDITKIDSFIKLVPLIYNDGVPDPTSVAITETFDYSNSKPSRWANLGRPRIEGDVVKGEFKAEIRYSREWIRGSKINNIIRFYPEDIYDSREPFYGAKENYGGIQYLIDRENRVICVQETKVGYIPVNRSIIEDTEEQAQIGISSTLLNPIGYYAGANIGIGKDYAIPSLTYNNGAAYFIDPHNHSLIRAGVDGTRDVSGKYSTALANLVKEALDNSSYIRTLYDKKYYEVLIIFPDTVLTFSEAVGGFTPKKPYTPEAGFTLGDRFYTFKEGELYIHDNEVNRGSFYGVNYPATITFAVGSPDVKHFQSLEIHSGHIIPTDSLGIETQLGQISELSYPTDFRNTGLGVFTANFLRDINSPGGIVSGDRLTGRWVKMTLKLPASDSQPKLNLFKVVVKGSRAMGNIF